MKTDMPAATGMTMQEIKNNPARARAYDAVKKISRSRMHLIVTWHGGVGVQVIQA